MKIYTSMVVGNRLKKIEKYNLGLMITPHKTFQPRKQYAGFNCAMDNGAFPAYLKGKKFDELEFLKCLEKCNSLGIDLDFIVCPDIVAGGNLSLDFSMKWVDRLSDYNLALAVQDGIDQKNIDYKYFSHVFIGGTIPWKWKTADSWKRFTDSAGLKLHIGRCGKLTDMISARKLGADSIDSSSLSRNQKWQILEQLENQTSF